MAPEFSSSLAGARVLVVEDDPRIAKQLQLVLAKDGASSESAMQLSAALEWVRVGSFDAALVDLGLPDGDGEDVIRALRQAAEPTASVVLTGHADPTRARKVLLAGAVDYLLKPLDPAPVLRALARAVRASRNARATVARLRVHAPRGASSPGILVRCSKSKRTPEMITSHPGVSRRLRLDELLADPRLSPRQAEVLRLLAEGMTNEAIAARLAISVAGVKFHLARIYKRTGLSRHTLLPRLAKG